MKQLLLLAASFAAGYLLVTKAAPAAQAWLEAQDLDEMWDVFDSER